MKILAAFTLLVLLSSVRTYAQEPAEITRLQSAADWGDKKAAYELYQKYEKGDGVPRDHQKADYWLGLSGRKEKAESHSDNTKVQAEASPSYASSDNFVTVLGRVDTGVILYDKATKEPWGIIMDVPSWGKVTIARIDRSSLGSGRIKGEVAEYDRGYITSNYVTKPK